ncbi:hypothetical protein D6D23_01309 [Aureobasidium pullulans]|nr:hypothetical protein D6D23_01309 [Aureobasidium pullulans]
MHRPRAVSTMTRRHPVNNPDAAESSRQSWERFTWLSVSKECRKRGYYPDTDAYDGKGPGVGMPCLVPNSG